MYAKMWSRQSVREASSDPNDHHHHRQAASLWHLGHGTAKLDLWPATRLFGVPCVLYIIMPYQPIILFFYFFLYIYFLFCL